MATEFVITTERIRSMVVVGCRGELDIAACTRLDEELAGALCERPRGLIFDGRGITLVSGSGVTTLSNLARSCRERGVSLGLRLSRRARRVLALHQELGLLGEENPLAEALRAHSAPALQPRSSRAASGAEGGDGLHG